VVQYGSGAVWAHVPEGPGYFVKMLVAFTGLIGRLAFRAGSWRNGFLTTMNRTRVVAMGTQS